MKKNTSKVKKFNEPVSSPQLPGYEALEGGVALVDEGAAPGPAEAQGALEALGLPIVEDVALAVVGGGRARGLVPELRAPLDGQGLVRVDEGLAQGQLHREGRRGGRLQVDRDEGPGHRRVAGQEQRLALLQRSGEPVADGVGAQVGPVVAHPDDYGPRYSVVCKKSARTLDKQQIAFSRRGAAS